MLEEIIYEQRLRTTRDRQSLATPVRPKPQPVKPGNANPLRPTTLDTMIGQDRLRSMMRRVIDSALVNRQPLDHLLLVGASGTGKSTIAGIVGNELGANVYQVEAPISHETLLDLREVMQDGDVLFIDEIHQQAIMERRGKVSSTQPEVLFNVMEDRTIVTGSGVLDYPAITLIGATTDEGMLPDPFINRFALRPVIAPYTVDDLAVMAGHNAAALACVIDGDAARLFAGAARLTPRVLNNYVKNAASLTPAGHIDLPVAEEVLFDLNGVTEDGLTADMQDMLRFMYSRCKKIDKSGVISYKASVSTIATAIGKSRDQKAVQLRVEPYLILAGFVQVGSNGRLLTDAGVRRARQLSSTR
jgi:Holliday junction DNA helicase RuvB